MRVEAVELIRKVQVAYSSIANWTWVSGNAAIRNEDVVKSRKQSSHVSACIGGGCGCHFAFWGEKSSGDGMVLFKLFFAEPATDGCGCPQRLRKLPKRQDPPYYLPSHKAPSAGLPRYDRTIPD